MAMFQLAIAQLSLKIFVDKFKDLADKSLIPSARVVISSPSSVMLIPVFFCFLSFVCVGFGGFVGHRSKNLFELVLVMRDEGSNLGFANVVVVAVRELYDDLLWFQVFY